MHQYTRFDVYGLLLPDTVAIAINNSTNERLNGPLRSLQGLQIIHTEYCT
jgi:hypothetical protein